MLNVKTLFSTEDEVWQKRSRTLSFNIHNCLPCIVQHYNRKQKTVDVQPAIRERFVGQDGRIQYVNYPLLINVPVAFPSAGKFRIELPISKGDECLVVFSDLAIDNWWKDGNIQNPVELRRHDLSDGIAIFGLQNQAKINREQSKAPSNKMSLFNSDTGTGINIGEYGIELVYYRMVEGELVKTVQRLGDAD